MTFKQGREDVPPILSNSSDDVEISCIPGIVKTKLLQKIKA